MVLGISRKEIISQINSNAAQLCPIAMLVGHRRRIKQWMKINRCFLMFPDTAIEENIHNTGQLDHIKRSWHVERIYPSPMEVSNQFHKKTFGWQGEVNRL